MKLTPQQALEEAKKRYPIGTFYRDLSGVVCLVEDISKFHVSAYGTVYHGGNIIYLHATTVWAEIVRPPKSLEERLVDEYGFEKAGFGYGECKTNRYVKAGLTIDFDYKGEDILSVNGLIKLTSFQNPKNLEAFIKAYLELF